MLKQKWKLLHDCVALMLIYSTNTCIPYRNCKNNPQFDEKYFQQISGCQSVPCEPPFYTGFESSEELSLTQVETFPIRSFTMLDVATLGEKAGYILGPLKCQRNSKLKYSALFSRDAMVLSTFIFGYFFLRSLCRR